MRLDHRDVELWNAIEHDRPEELKRLLAAGVAPIYHFDDGWTPLHHAVDAESDYSNQDGTAADLRLIAPLIAAGADLHARWHNSNGRVETPLDIAVGYCNWGAAKAIENALSASDD